MVVLDEKQSLPPNNQQEQLDVAPPPYSQGDENRPTSAAGSAWSADRQPVASSSSAAPRPAASPITRIQRANFVHIVTPSQPIKGSWHIDPKMPAVSRNLLSRPPIEGPRPNLYLSSDHQPIKATVYLSTSIQSTPVPRVLIVADTMHRNINISIPSRSPSSIKFHLRVATTHGNVVIRLPADFVGPVRYRADGLDRNSAVVRFTPAIRPHLTILAQEATEGHAFVGDLVDSGYLSSAQLFDDGHSNQAASSSGGSAAQEQRDTDPSQLPEGASQAAPSEIAEKLATPIETPIAETPVIPKPQSWQGDELEVISLYGRIKICYDGEESEETAAEEFTRHLKESGPIVSLFKLASKKVKAAAK